MKITHDRSPVSVVTTCSECPFWTAFSFTLEEANNRAANHKILVHGIEPGRAHEANRKRATRREKRAMQSVAVILRSI